MLSAAAPYGDARRTIQGSVPVHPLPWRLLAYAARERLGSCDPSYRGPRGARDDGRDKMMHDDVYYLFYFLTGDVYRWPR